VISAAPSSRRGDRDIAGSLAERHIATSELGHISPRSTNPAAAGHGSKPAIQAAGTTRPKIANIGRIPID
jgi:predicted amino acid racemase